MLIINLLKFIIIKKFIFKDLNLYKRNKMLDVEIEKVRSPIMIDDRLLSNEIHTINECNDFNLQFKY